MYGLKYIVTTYNKVKLIYIKYIQCIFAYHNITIN